jgi:DNA-binding NarL/FixJ family response regulator
MEKVIKLGLADDHVILRQSMISTLKRYKDLNVVLDEGNGQELLERLRTVRTDIVLLDIDMPLMDGREALDRMNRQFPDVKVIILSMYSMEKIIIEFISNGARAFLPKDIGISRLIEAIHAVYTYDYYFDKHISDILAKQKSDQINNRSSTDSKITKQEIKILELLQLNNTNEEIADILCLNVRTVESNRASLRHKTGSDNWAAVLTYVVKHGISSGRIEENLLKS